MCVGDEAGARAVRPGDAIGLQAAADRTRFSAQAQVYPSRPITIVVPYAAGGPVDSMGRLLAPRLVEIWGQQIVIDNRAGANSIVGSEVAARAAPDGYNLVLISASRSTRLSIPNCRSIRSAISRRSRWSHPGRACW